MQSLIIDNKEAYSELQAYLSENPPILEERDGYIRTDEYEFFVKWEEENNLDDLFFGKDTRKKVTAIEVTDNEDILFYADGTTETQPHVYWLLTEVKLDGEFRRLNGNQHYKWIREFSDKEEYFKFRGLLSKKRVDYYCVWNEKESAMIYHGITLFSDMKMEDVSVLSFDIEADGLVEHKDSKVFLITNTFRNNGQITKKHFRLDNYDDDCGAMISDWCDWVRKVNPTIINGHNIFGYDFRYLNHVAKLYNTELLLGKDGSAAKFGKKAKKYRVDGSQTWDYYNVEIFGRHIIDGMFLAVKYDIGRNYPSWGLKPIAEYEGLVKEDRQFYDASKIGENWYDPVEREKIVAYGIDDSDDSLGLLDLMLPSFFYTAQSIPKPLQVVINSASGSWLNSIMVRAYLQEGSSIPKANEQQRVAGGMSYGIPGIYSNVAKFDAASFYPSTVLTFKIYDEKKDPKAYYYEMVKYFTEKRFEQKGKFKETGDKYYDDLQASSKVFINSAYGLLGTPGLNFNSFENASLITKCCRKGLQKCIEWATGKDANYWWEDYEEEQDFPDYSFIDSKAELSAEEMPRHDWQLVNIDTDSLSFCKADQSEWTESDYEKVLKEINQIMYSPWEDDGNFDRFVVLKAKNYAMRERGKDKIKIKGSSFIDAKKEPALREMMKNLVTNFINHDLDYVSVYHQYLREALDIQDISRWCVKKSITEKLLEANDTAKQKVLAAIGDKKVSVGDKVYLYNAIDGMVQKVAKGEPVFLKSGEPKMIENRIVRLRENFDGDYEKMHYVKRVFKTMEIFQNIIDMDKILNYSLKKNVKLLEEL